MENMEPHGFLSPVLCMVFSFHGHHKVDAFRCDHLQERTDPGWRRVASPFLLKLPCLQPAALFREASAERPSELSHFLPVKMSSQAGRNISAYFTEEQAETQGGSETRPGSHTWAKWQSSGEKEEACSQSSAPPYSVLPAFGYRP